MLLNSSGKIFGVFPKLLAALEFIKHPCNLSDILTSFIKNHWMHQTPLKYRQKYAFNIAILGLDASNIAGWHKPDTHAHTRWQRQSQRAARTSSRRSNFGDDLVCASGVQQDDAHAAQAIVSLPPTNRRPSLPTSPGAGSVGAAQDVDVRSLVIQGSATSVRRTSRYFQCLWHRLTPDWTGVIWGIWQWCIMVWTGAIVGESKRSARWRRGLTVWSVAKIKPKK